MYSVPATSSADFIAIADPNFDADPFVCDKGALCFNPSVSDLSMTKAVSVDSTSEPSALSIASIPDVVIPDVVVPDVVKDVVKDVDLGTVLGGDSVSETLASTLAVETILADSVGPSPIVVSPAATVDASVPEPSTFAFLALGLAACYRWQRGAKR